MDPQTLVEQGYVDEFDQAVFICSNPAITGDFSPSMAKILQES
jgi:hypothetical protein